jgi:Protein of unknown function (DUF2992)
VSSTFTVYFDGQFWVGVLEIREDGSVRAARHVFGAEPSGPELCAFGLGEFDQLLDAATASTPVSGPIAQRVNPKRAARLAARSLAERPVSTAAQDAMRRSIEVSARQRQVVDRQQRDAESERRRELRRTKARSRHRGTG